MKEGMRLLAADLRNKSRYRGQLIPGVVYEG